MKLAELAGMSATSLRNKYKDYYGITIKEDYRACKMIRAKELLEAGYRVNETAYMVGFRDVSSFSTAFSTYHRIRPKEIVQSNSPPLTLS